MSQKVVELKERGEAEVHFLDLDLTHTSCGEFLGDLETFPTSEEVRVSCILCALRVTCSTF